MASKAAVEAGKAFVEFFLEDGKLRRGLKASERRVQMWARRVGNTSKRILRAATIGLAAFAFPVRTFAQFDDKMRLVKGLTKANTDEFRKLTEQAKELGRTTSFTASDVAGAQIEQARAGFNVGEIQASTADLLNFARATDTDLARATEIGAGAMRAFGLSANEMGRVVNVATATVNNSSQGLEDYGEAMKVAAPIAKQYGMTIEETSKIVGTLADFQLKGSLAGTQIKMALLQMADPSVRRKIEKFTPLIDKSTGRLKTLDAVARELGQAASGESAEQRLKRLALFTQIFGKRAAAAAGVLTGPMKDAFAEAFGDPEFAKKLAEEMDSGIGGSIRKMQSAFEGMQIAIGEAVDKTGQDVFGFITEWLGSVTAFANKNPELITGAIKVIAAIAAMAVAGIALSVALKGVALVIKALSLTVSVAVGVFKVAAGAVMFLASPVGLLVALVAGLAAWFIYASGAIAKVSAFMESEFGETWKTIVALLKAGELQAAGELALALLKTAWAIGVAELDKKWSEWTNGLAMLLTEGVAGAEIAWNHFTTALVNAFDVAIGYIRNAWQETTNWLADKIAIVIAKSSGQNVEDVRQTLRETQARDRRDFAGEAKQRAAARNMKTRERTAQIGQELQDKKEALEQQLQAKIDAANTEANKARALFDQAQARAQEAVRKNQDAEGNAEGVNPGQAPGEINLGKMVSNATLGAVAFEQKNEAQVLRSKAAQETLAAAMGFSMSQEPVVAAVESMAEQVQEELEDVNQNLQDAQIIRPG